MSVGNVIGKTYNIKGNTLNKGHNKNTERTWLKQGHSVCTNLLEILTDFRQLIIELPHITMATPAF
jgi:hypothetical protein